MIRQYVLLVDAGYLLASAGKLVLNTSLRNEFRADTAGFVDGLIKVAAERLTGDLLRVYWFDAARDKVPTVEQRTIAQMPSVKLRIGNVNASGQQKGVDAQIRMDLEALAKNHAITDAILVAGDEDMVPAVEAAQNYGVRVHVWGVEPPFGYNQAERLLWEADQYHQLDEEFCRPYVRRPKVTPPVPAPVPLALPAPPPIRPTVPAGPRPTPPPPRMAPPSCSLDMRIIEEVGEMIAHRWITVRGRDNLGDLLPDAPRLPVAIDRELLIAAEVELRTTLRTSEEGRRKLRDGFWNRLFREFGEPERTGDR